nr:helical backbone metal receptor [Candidatus Methanofastidiosa archaeon]
VLDMEWLIDNDPDVIILTPHGSSGLSKEDLMSDPNYSTISAVQNDQVYELSNADIILRPGPRIVDAIEEVYSFMPTSISVTDDLGNQYTFDSTATRIISLAPSNTEILFALGLDEEIIGVTEYCNYPEAALEKETVGGFSTVDVERVIELEPDVVFATSGDEESYELIRTAGIPVIQFQAVDFETVYKDIRIVGKVTGKDQEAYDLVMDMKERISAVEEQVANITDKKSVLYMLWYDPLMSAGPNTFIDQIITTAGGENVAGESDAAWPVLSLDWVIDQDPDAIILAPHEASGVSKEELMDNGNWSTVSAIINGEVYELSSSDIISRPGPRIADAVEEIFNLMYG